MNINNGLVKFQETLGTLTDLMITSSAMKKVMILAKMRNKPYPLLVPCLSKS